MEHKPRILIIDDEEVVLDSCTQILEDGDYQIKTAGDGKTGLERVEEFEPDLAFVDLKMPGISGFEVLERIHDLDSTIVTIVITGYATLDSAVEAMKKGAYDFVAKPFTPDELRLITERGLENRELVLETVALRKEREMLREHFAAIVSHELKSPLGAVQQNLYTLAEELSDKLTENERKRLERMKASLDDLMKLIHTWLRTMSGDIGEIRERFEPISIAAVMSRAVENVEPHATRKDIEIRTSVEESLGPVHGDEVTLVEALVNLVNNAVKYSRLGSEVHVKAEGEGDEVVIAVTDSGIGIPEDDLPHIFQAFYRGGGQTSSAVQEEKGSGLGLALTRRIVEAHGGSISVNSKLGEGSTFVIRLPVARSEEAEQEDEKVRDLSRQPALDRRVSAES